MRVKLPRRAAGIDALLAEVRELAKARAGRADRETDLRLLRARHRAGMALMETPLPAGEPPSETDGTPAFRVGPTAVPEIAATDLTPAAARAAIGEHGCLLVRGLVPAAEAVRLTADIDRAYEARERHRAGTPTNDGWYEKFEPDPRFDLRFARAVVNQAGFSSLWAADSPTALQNVLDVYDRVGLRSFLTGYLGEHAAMSVNKLLLRRVRPDEFRAIDDSTGTKPSAWHQDGAFLGSVKALNVWVALSRCGDIAPGMDVIPTRIDQIVDTGTEGAPFNWSVSQALADREAGSAGVARPIFDPGDALLFDEMLLHSTAAEPEMTAARYAVESWFFAPSAFPEGYAPLAL